MKGHPKYKVGDMVTFPFYNSGLTTGMVYIVDAYGTFEDDSDVSYDIMVDNYRGVPGEQCLFKHINEKYIIDPIH